MTKTKPSATVILDSMSPDGLRLTTLEVVMHRYMAPEFLTHRRFSRNAASNRAAPVRTNIEKALADPAIPTRWGTRKVGMQAGPPLTGVEARFARAEWLKARDNAVATVEVFDELGVHKEVANRVLEPFLWHTVIVTSTEWDNFWNLRVSPLAQPEMEALAKAMKKAYRASVPTPVGWGHWHTPYIRPEEYTELHENTRKKVSAARCARVSYLTHDGKRDVEKDMQLYDRLVYPADDQIHASPLEHVATPAISNEKIEGNFIGWHQLRHGIERLRRGESESIPVGEKVQ